MPYVVLARADDLDGPAHGLGCRCRMQGEVGHVLAPEAASEEGGVHDDLVRRHPAGLAEFAAQEILALVGPPGFDRSEEHTSELQSPCNLVCRLLLEKKKTNGPEISQQGT